MEMRFAQSEWNLMWFLQRDGRGIEDGRHMEEKSRLKELWRCQADGS